MFSKIHQVRIEESLYCKKNKIHTQILFQFNSTFWIIVVSFQFGSHFSRKKNGIMRRMGFYDEDLEHRLLLYQCQLIKKTYMIKAVMLEIMKGRSCYDVDEAIKECVYAIVVSCCQGFLSIVCCTLRDELGIERVCLYDRIASYYCIVHGC